MAEVQRSGFNVQGSGLEEIRNAGMFTPLKQRKAFLRCRASLGPGLKRWWEGWKVGSQKGKWRSWSETFYGGIMDFYLNLLNDLERGPGNQMSIGIILCAEKDVVEVEYALRSKANPIGVAACQLYPELPGELEGKLPNSRQLADVMKAGMKT